MSQEPSSTSEEPLPRVTLDASPTEDSERIEKEEATEFLKEMGEVAGQISETENEEENLVREFFNSLYKILKPFSKTLEISVSSLPKDWARQAIKAHLNVSGQLVIVRKNGDVEMLDLKEKDNRRLFIDIIGEIVAQLKTIIDSYKSDAEKRVEFLLPLTKELQKIAQVFSERL